MSKFAFLFNELGVPYSESFESFDDAPSGKLRNTEYYDTGASETRTERVFIRNPEISLAGSMPKDLSVAIAQIVKHFDKSIEGFLV